MASTIRVYRHPSGTAPANPTQIGTDQTDADDGLFSVQVSTTGVPAGTYDVTVTREYTTGGLSVSAYSNALSLTVQSAAALTIENSYANYAAGGTTIVQAITASAGSLILVMTACEPDAAVSSLPRAPNGSVAGSGLTFSDCYAFTDPGDYVAGGYACYATAPGGGFSGNITATFEGNMFCGIMAIWVLTGHNSSDPVGAVIDNTSGTAGDVSQAIVAEATGSYIFAVAVNVDGTATSTAGANCTVAHVDSNYRAWDIRSTNTVSAGSFTIASTSTSSGTPDYVVVEIKAA